MTRSLVHVYVEFQLCKQGRGDGLKIFLSPVYRGKPKQEENNYDRLIADSIYELTPNCISL